MARHDWWGVGLEAPDTRELARFYWALLGWEVAHEDDDGAAVVPPEGAVYLDFEVSDLRAAVAHAVELGARESGFQPQDHVRVLLDPAGHPFCLYKDGS
ncbi:VOC family protein [Streptomyces roseirectus]|uniref:VOC family protein n=1 Tax=Streptomyces roseirectus TaxID=2768066 RepID=A0A7H0IQK0_9ACTN|nr:VOC family protein [Streptomyces roseirectus]QNP75066.1 VOC family protein [Streptomyces roseirectus]